ncbi:unnamed protein product [Leptidea sinapis]|uniref:snRNA-activating protein complex subunit 3 n=1 Tax=Leptidea sinapis TaxID=189913 RepID=A0A5E4QNS8_9NEOP|nr:unnamed protein product [Leptidea sinapis]
MEKHDIEIVAEHSNLTTIEINPSVSENVDLEKETSNDDVSNSIPLFAPDDGPKIYNIQDDFVTPPLIASNLPELFNSLPIHGQPEPAIDLKTFQENKIREFVGRELRDCEFEKLVAFCNPKHLLTGNEVRMPTAYPTTVAYSSHEDQKIDDDTNLNILKKLKVRIDNDRNNLYSKRLKYRGVRVLPPPKDEDSTESEQLLMPGKDVLYQVRLYRPFHCSLKERQGFRYTVFSNDLVLLGRHYLSDLRDRISCPNDSAANVDVNTFYVDERPGCKDISRVVRDWAERKKIGRFLTRSMNTTRLRDVDVRLGHPDVFVHQGNCEHLLTLSVVRLLSAMDVLRPSLYPHHTQLTSSQTVYCASCAEFASTWLVGGCERVPFDPTFFCDTCFRRYLYKDGKKICEFKAFAYKGYFDFNVLKPMAREINLN